MTALSPPAGCALTRAEARAVEDWANAHTASLRRLAAKIAVLDDLAPASADLIGRLDQALGDADGAALPALLAQTRVHLSGHPDLAGQVEAVNAHVDRVRRESQTRRGADRRR